MNFFSEISNEQFLSKIEQVLDRALNIYSENKNLQRLWSHLLFLYNILKNTNKSIQPMVLNTSSIVYIKAMEKSMDYVLTILSFLQGIVNGALVHNDEEDMESEDISEGMGLLYTNWTRFGSNYQKEKRID
jgi:hypothetical protein